jgi:DNA-binding NtrC family response regulator
MRFTSEALAVLSRHDFPGNVRELSTVVRRLVVFCDDDEIGPADVVRELDSHALDEDPQEEMAEALRKARLDVRRTFVLRALELTNGNKKQAAELLGIARRTLFNWMDELDLNREKDDDED